MNVGGSNNWLALAGVAAVSALTTRRTTFGCTA